MSNEIDNTVVNVMKMDLRREYTIPEIMEAINVKSREKVIAVLARLEGRNVVEVSREKGRTKYYRLKQ